jgi:hypothetical protein
MERVVAYVAGSNLYLGLKHSGFKRYYWLDAAALAASLLKPGQQLVVSHDFIPIHRVRQRFPAKRVIVAFPPRRYSSELKRCPSGYLSIGEDKLRANQLPDSIVKPDGFMLQRPITWR